MKMTEVQIYDVSESSHCKASYKVDMVKENKVNCHIYV